MILIVRGVIYVGGPFEVHKIVVEKQRLEVFFCFMKITITQKYIRSTRDSVHFNIHQSGSVYLAVFNIG